jgi:hypothetical protein
LRACRGSVASVLVMNTSACDAEVTQLLSARSTTEPDGDRFACDTGAQKWLREPFSLNASVPSFEPDANDDRSSSLGSVGGAAAVAAEAARCIR